MNKQPLKMLLLALWLVAFGASFWALFMVDPTGFGFTRGLNRLTDFVVWQMLASGLAAIIWLLGRKSVAGSRELWLSRVPGLMALLLVLAIILIIVIAQINYQMKPVAPELSNPKPVAEPVD